MEPAKKNANCEKPEAALEPHPGVTGHPPTKMRTDLPGMEGLRKNVGRYFADCEERGRVPSRTGLALALGLSGRRRLEELIRRETHPGKQWVLEHALSQIEEETIQAAYRRETAAGARFLLQNAFGYGEPQPQDWGDFQVVIS